MRPTRHRLPFHPACLACAGLWVLPAPRAGAEPFTYQARVTDNGAPLDDTCDFTFRLYNQATGGTLIGTDPSPAVTVVGGLMTTTLDFGATAFDGSNRFLEIEMNCGSGATILGTRRPVGYTPMAQYAANSAMLGGFPAEDYLLAGEDAAVIYSLNLTINDSDLGPVLKTPMQGCTFSLFNTRGLGGASFSQDAVVTLSLGPGALHAFNMFTTLEGNTISLLQVDVVPNPGVTPIFTLSMEHPVIQTNAFGASFSGGVVDFSQGFSVTCKKFTVSSGGETVVVDLPTGASGPGMPANRSLYTGTSTGPGMLQVEAYGETASASEPYGMATVDYKDLSLLLKDILATADSAIPPLKLQFVDLVSPGKTMRAEYEAVQLHTVSFAVDPTAFKWSGVYIFGKAEWEYQSGSSIWHGDWNYSTNSGGFTHP